MTNYREYINSPEWKRKAEDAKKRVGYRCQVCNSQIAPEAHHRTYERLGDERPEDITILCHDCHELFSAKMAKQNGKDFMTNGDLMEALLGPEMVEAINRGASQEELRIIAGRKP